VAAKGQRALTCGGCGGAAGRRNPARFGGGGEAGGGGRKRERAKLCCATAGMVSGTSISGKRRETEEREKSEPTDLKRIFGLPVLQSAQSTVALGPSASTVHCAFGWLAAFGWAGWPLSEKQCFQPERYFFLTIISRNSILTYFPVLPNRQAIDSVWITSFKNLKILKISLEFNKNLKILKISL